jgi:predicted transcriptional regulator
MSRVELAVEKVRNLSEAQVEALLDWLKLRERPEDLRRRIDAEIDVGLNDVREGRVFPGEQVHAEIRERSRKRRAAQNG